MLNHDSIHENRTEILRKVYQKVLTAAAHRHAKWWLALVAFIESSIFLIPPDVMLIPMVLANRSQWWRLALTATIASVMGGLAGYAIGLFLYETIGNVVIGFYAYGDKFLEYMDIYEEWGGWAVFGAGLTPFPYKVITIASGVVKIDLSVFILMSLIARGIRFFSVAGLLYYFGESAKLLIEKYFGLITVLFFIILVAGFFIISFAF